MVEIVTRIGVRREQSSAERTDPLRQDGMGPARGSSTSERRSLQLTIDDIAHSAYMVNYNFELAWYNEAARQNVLGFNTPPPGSASRNIFLMLLDASGAKPSASCTELLRLHIVLAKARLSKASMQGIVKSLDGRLANLIDEVYDQSDGVTGQTVVEVPCTLNGGAGESGSWLVYGIYFREGILIVHVPSGQADPGLLDFLSRRDVVIRNLLRKRLPVLTPLAVMVADLQHSVKICSELPPEEYFELINEIWSTMAPVFRKYYGTHGKHVGDGMVYYFFPQPDRNYIFNTLACAHEVKLEMHKISTQWRSRKNWLNELVLNIGLHEGQEWLGTFQSATSVEFVVLGDTINHAARLSDFARYGAIWATKNLVSKLTKEERSQVEFGITRRGEGDREHFVMSSYSQIGALVDLSSERYETLRDISTLPVTEIRSVKLGQ
jgi:adenylate cyclase